MTFYIDEKTKELFLSCCEIQQPTLSILEEQDVDSLHEKHIPKIEIKDNHVKVEVGDIMHPMTPEHYISLIFLETETGGQIKHLTYTDQPIANFEMNPDDRIKAVYEYCTLHGLWKINV